MTASPHILYVDDDQDSCLLMGMLLRQHNPNYGIVAVENAAEALALINGLPFDLYILDYRIPDMSGVELCRLIRQTDTETPILMYSAMGREIDRESAQRAGVTEYLIKPNDLDNFAPTVERLLNKIH